MPKQATNEKAESPYKKLERKYLEAVATIERQQAEITRLTRQNESSLESSPMYKQAMEDLAMMRDERDMYKDLYGEMLRKEQNRVKPGRKNVLSPEQMEEIRQKRNEGETLRGIAAEYGVSLATVQRTLGLL